MTSLPFQPSLDTPLRTVHRHRGVGSALLDSVLQAFLDAPLFVWYEVAFACGYDPALKQELDAAVEKQHAAWDL